MDYTLRTSLEHRALVKTAVTLWNQGDIKTLIARVCFPLLEFERQRWQEIEDKVLRKVPDLPLPEPTRKKVLGVVRPIGLEILNWAEYHVRCCFSAKLQDILYWTPDGTVDKRKTAEALIRDENLDITKRYKLACIYCLEKDIPVLWHKMPEIQRELFYSKEGPRNVKQQEKLVVFWTYDVNGEVARMEDMVDREWRKCTTYQYAFECAAISGNKVATEYFLQILTHEERDESLVKYAGYVANRRCDSARTSTGFSKEDYAEVLCFLLSQMNEEQQIEVFKSYPYEVLMCLLNWRWQGFFMQTANHMWTFLPERKFDDLLRFIVIHKFMADFKDYNYQKLFWEFWQQSPDSHKRYVIGQCASGLLLYLFMDRDKENIWFILKDATYAEKEEIIFDRMGMIICKRLVYREEWDLLKLFINECISSQEKMIEFKKDITGSCSKNELSERKDKWDIFVQILDDFILEHNSRKSAEGNGFPAKKLCNVESEKEFLV